MFQGIKLFEAGGFFVVWIPPPPPHFITWCHSIQVHCASLFSLHMLSLSWAYLLSNVFSVFLRPVSLKCYCYKCLNLVFKKTQPNHHFAKWQKACNSDVRRVLNVIMCLCFQEALIHGGLQAPGSGSRIWACDSCIIKCRGELGNSA